MATLAILGMLAAPAQASPHGGKTFRIHVTVTTKHRTVVRVRWRVTCYAGTASAGTRGSFLDFTPTTRYLPQSLPGATRCEVHAVAWNALHPKGQVPVVYTYVVPV